MALLAPGTRDVQTPRRAASAATETFLNRFPQLDILPAAQRSLWPQLAEVSRHSFVLYGGTAVALYLGHRESIDFDFFTHLPFQADELIERHPFLVGAEILQSQKNTLTVITAGPEIAGVKISFFGGLKFGRLAPPRETPDAIMKVASLQDLLAHKLKTILQRVEAKDYVDVDALLQAGLGLSAGLAGAQLLFPAFAPQECLKALTYFADEGLRELPRDLEERLLSAVKNVRSLPTVAPNSCFLSD